MHVDVELGSRADTVRWGRLPCRHDEPVAVVRDGGTIAVETVSHEGLLDDQGRDPVAFFGVHGVAPSDVLADAVRVAADVPRAPDDGPHVVTGPIAVPGARPGDLLEIEVLALERRTDYGIISNRHGRGALPDEFPEFDEHGHQPVVHSTFARVDPRTDSGLIDAGSAGRSRTLRFPLNEFLGIVGVASATDDRLHSVPPGNHGGNLDIKHLGRASRLYLPVQVEGAMAYVGDPHFAQGNGEVVLTAFEAPLRAVLRLTVHRGDTATAMAAQLGPFGETGTHWILTGLDVDLDVAFAHATRHAIDFLHQRFAIPRPTALAYLSAAGDFEVSQVVDRVKGIHCCIRKADLAELSDQSTTEWLS